ncbi:MAG: hypothetical protein TQ37_05400 [Candidatus Synechococcus spongiarum 15L]|uniref:J domain-containing protein n=2 Tax=Candidatus Synechococcus spongiarum TaxID=431041 RepID=A0A1T1C7P5_9SYNE|nr:MAG: hypothetical protein TQ37_05400 [Candidatus Synechococcus spongiarum 15L]OOV24632.1 hypothetical protein BV61_07470 [Candidatus Synechococcus spongiarum LMB bulk15M]
MTYYNLDLYCLLGVNKDAKQDRFKIAYRSLALKYHPDVNKETGSEERFKKINFAYKALSDSEKRERYNKYLEERKNKADVSKYSTIGYITLFATVLSMLVLLVATLFPIPPAPYKLLAAILIATPRRNRTRLVLLLVILIPISPIIFQLMAFGLLLNIMSLLTYNVCQ